ncbi:MAG: hypothetical protein CL941_04495 [Desulfobacter sp.]|nr:hypothetical protein [Desulfobacter sp.]
MHTASVRFLKTDQQKNRVVWPPEMSHNILHCNDATASPKRLQTTKIQIPDEDRIVKKAFCCKLTKNQGLWSESKYFFVYGFINSRESGPELPLYRGSHPIPGNFYENCDNNITKQGKKPLKAVKLGSITKSYLFL